MLKSVDVSKAFYSNIGIKCAEVYLIKEEQYSIVCSRCQLKAFDFGDFLQHFRNAHLLAAGNAAEPDVRIKVEEEDIELCSEDEHKPEAAQFAEFLEVPMSPVKRSDSPPMADCLGTPSSHSIMETKWPSTAIDSESEDTVEDDSAKEADYTPTILKRQLTRTTKSFKCTDCSNTYRFSKNLERHIKKCHSAGEYKCSKCEQVFCQERALNAHQRKDHAGYPCPQCDKVYKNKESLRVHEYNHSGVRNFACDVDDCDKAFFNPKLLCIHKRVVHSSERNFVCEMCGYRTKKKNALEVHKRSHTGERPFICKVCDKGFASQSLLSEHMPIHSTERPHKCDVCGATFSRSKALYHHKHLHLGIKKFICKLCGRAYAQMAGLAGHMRQHKAEQF